MTTFRGGVARAMALEAGHPEWWEITSWTVKRPKELSDGDECDCLNCAVGITK